MTGHQAALTLLATIVNRPAPERAILDIGQQSASGYRTSPIPRDFSSFPIIDLFAEHAIIQVFSGEVRKIDEK